VFYFFNDNTKISEWGHFGDRIIKKTF